MIFIILSSMTCNMSYFCQSLNLRKNRKLLYFYCLYIYMFFKYIQFFILNSLSIFMFFGSNITIYKCRELYNSGSFYSQSRLDLSFTMGMVVVYNSFLLIVWWIKLFALKFSLIYKFRRWYMIYHGGLNFYVTSEHLWNSISSYDN